MDSIIDASENVRNAIHKLRIEIEKNKDFKEYLITNNIYTPIDEADYIEKLVWLEYL